jgi:hypothetical protein
MLRCKVDDDIRTGKGFIQSIKLADIGINAEMRIFPAALFINNGYIMPCSNKTCCKTGADKTETVDGL